MDIVTYDVIGDTQMTTYKEVELEISKQEAIELLIEAFIENDYILEENIEIKVEDKFFTLSFDEYFNEKQIEIFKKIENKYFEMNLSIQDIKEVITIKGLKNVL
jgi:Leucine-rich repeat (LRR) protein